MVQLRFLLVLLLALLAAPAHAFWRGSQAAPTTGLITTSGAQILRDGQPWVPKGVALLAFTAPAGMESDSGFAAAKTYWLAHAPQEIAQIKAYGADLVRVNVSQCGLDWTRGVLTTAAYNQYVNQVVTAVNQILGAGLNVMLMLQAEPSSGCTDTPRLPGLSTIRALQTLAPIWANDQRVMIELFNEPNECATPFTGCVANWQAQHQMLVTAVRALGVKNVLVVGGLSSSRYFIYPGWGQIAPLQDPLNRIVYAIHPYQNVYQTSTDLDTYMGNWCSAEGVPCIAAEWHLDSYTSTCGDVTPTSNIPTVADTIMSWLKSKGIGVILWAWDRPNTLNTDYTVNTLTDMNTSFTCDKSQSPPQGVGVMGHEYFSQ